MAPRNAEHILAQLLRYKSILNQEQFRKRTEYTGVALPSEYTRVSFIFPHERRGCKDVIKLQRITIKLKAKRDLG